jgi:hypothetical protein
MSEKAKPKARFHIRMKDGNYLGVTIWPGKADQAAEVITIQIRRNDGNNWETLERMALYRASNGDYVALPDRRETRENTTAQAHSPEEVV